MDLVPGDGRPARALPTPATNGPLLGDERRVDVEKPQRVGRPRGRLDPGLVDDASAEHLVATAEPEHHRGPGTGEHPDQRRLEAPPAQPVEIADG